jgi:hypothetical protein
VTAMLQRFRSVGLIFTIVLFNAVAYCQVPDPATAAQQPIPGSGHDYIRLGSETVNVATGIPSFELPINTPPGRGLSFPFGIRYSAAEPYYMGTRPNGVAWIASPGGVPNESGGWSYELPAYTAQAVVVHAYPDPSGSGTDVCDGTQNYIFRGFDGI